MVKQRCGTEDPACVVISQHTEIAEVPVFIANEAIKEHHAPDLTAVFGAEGIRIVNAFGNIYIFNQFAGCYIRGINIRKKFAGRRKYPSQRSRPYEIALSPMAFAICAA